MSALGTQLPEKAWDVGEIVGWMQAKKKLFAEHREPWLRFWLQCLRFWSGDHWRDVVESATYGWDTRDIRPVGTEELLLVDNQIPIYCRHLAAEAYQSTPRLIVKPSDPDDPEDVWAAQVGTAFLDSRRRADQEPVKCEEEYLWLLGLGECLRMTDLEVKGRPASDIQTEVIDSFRYIKDPWSTGWPPTCIFISEARHVDWVKAQWGVEVEPESLADTSIYYDMLSMNIMLGKQRHQRQEMANAAVVDQLWIPPGERYPNGWLYVRVGNKLVQSGPLQAGNWGLSLATFYPLPGRMNAMGLIELLMTDQRELDFLGTLLAESAVKEMRGDRMLSGAADERSIRTAVINPKTGQKITIVPPGMTFAPDRHGLDWQQGQVRRDQISQSLHEKAGRNQPTMGQTPQRQPTATEWLGSREGDLTVSQWHMARYAEQHLCAVAEDKIALAREYYVKPRPLHGVGASREMVEFTGADLAKAQDVVAVAVPNLTPTQKMRAQTDAYGNGLVGPYPTLAQRYAARLTLRTTGLDDVDEALASVYGPFEEDEAKMKQLAALQEAVEFATAQQMLNMAQNPPQVAPPGGEQPPQ